MPEVSRRRPASASSAGRSPTAARRRCTTPRCARARADATGATSCCRCRPSCSPRRCARSRASGFARRERDDPAQGGGARARRRARPTRARAIGAANTLTFDGDGAIHADNTDAPGLARRAPGAAAPGPRALVLGAGGSARAVVLRAARGRAPRSRSGTARRSARSALAADLGGRRSARPRPADLLVNCTSRRAPPIRPATFKELPVTADSIGTYATVVDLVYRPGGTALLARGTAPGMRGRRRPGDPGAAGRAELRGLDRPCRRRSTSCGRPSAEDLPIAPHEPRPSPSAPRGRAIGPADGGGRSPGRGRSRTGTAITPPRARAAARAS